MRTSSVDIGYWLNEGFDSESGDLHINIVDQELKNARDMRHPVLERDGIEYEDASHHITCSGRVYLKK